jgi:hypothetical protein
MLSNSHWKCPSPSPNNGTNKVWFKCSQ